MEGVVRGSRCSCWWWSACRAPAAPNMSGGGGWGVPKFETTFSQVEHGPIWSIFHKLALLNFFTKHKSVTFCYGSGSSDPYLLLTDPDEDPGGPKHTDPTDPDADSEHWSIYIILQRQIVIYKLQNSRSQGFFLSIFASWWKDPEPDPYLWLTDPDADPDPRL